MTSTFTLDWSDRFGLAHAPLFEEGEIEAPDRHAVLLDGGAGSFALSKSSEPLDPRKAASWAWSAGLPHHVGVAGEAVTVTRWDNVQSPERFTLSSVTQQLDTFYSYLSAKRSMGRRDVIATLLDLFRAIRGEIQAAGLRDEDAISQFLDLLSQLVSAERAATVGSSQTFSAIWSSIRAAYPSEGTLGTDRLERLEVGFQDQIASALGLSLSAALAVRHAASALFQEAHFAFQGTAQFDLFGHQPSKASTTVTRGSHHFTPPSLARSVVEQALHSFPNIKQRSSFVVCDPACGSGAFLTEALRTLRRLGFDGVIKLVGRDLSKSAILMAQFALQASKLDWQPRGGIEIDLKVADSLEADAMPKADLVVMNPPFLAWSMMDSKQRMQVSDALGSAARHRPDISMAFISRALAKADKGTVVASLIPSSVLVLDSGKAWRKSILETGRLRFLGSFGEYGLFVHALVQVAALVVAVGDQSLDGTALRSANEEAATGEALRALRKLPSPVVGAASGRGWRITPIDREVLANNDRWRILPSGVEDALSRLSELNMTTVGDLFHVRQGIRTGLTEAFVLTAEQLRELPQKEQQHFKPALFRDAISYGEIRQNHFVFFPYGRKGITIASESDLQQTLPSYYSSHLLPAKDKLQSRSGVGASDSPWWGLSRYYAWTQDPAPRILSKYFGTAGDFVLDAERKFVPIQGFAWFLKGGKAADASAVERALRAYLTVFNSSEFADLLSVFSEPVAGGQFDLSPRFVDPIPLPNLSSIEYASVTRQLERLAEAKDAMSPAWSRRVSEVTKLLWGEDLVGALLEMRDA